MRVLLTQLKNSSMKFERRERVNVEELPYLVQDFYTYDAREGVELGRAC